MVQVYYVFFQIFVCFILGFVLNKTRVLDMRGEKVMTEILLKAVLPFMIISSSQTNFSFEELKGMAAMFAFGAAYYSLALVLSRRAFKETKATDDEQRVMTTCTVFANTGFVGFPLMRALYGDRGLLLAAVFNLVYNAFFYTYGAHIISKKQHFKISELFASTVSSASIAAIILFILPWRIPGFVNNAISMIGDMSVPMSMMIMGSQLASVDPRKIFLDWKPYVVSFVRLMLIPAVALLAVWGLGHAFSIKPDTMKVMVLMCALPCGSMNVLYAEQYNTAPDLSTRIVTMSTVLMLVTLLFWTWIVRTVL